jgi:Icc-related predicted phosphoesterase
MIRRISVNVRPSASGFEEDPLRILAVSDEVERAFDFERNRTDLGNIDAIVGAGDLRPEYLDFLTMAFKAPLLYVRGNHDRGGGWDDESEHVPEVMDGKVQDLGGVRIAGLSWPCDRRQQAVHDQNLAWRQVARSMVAMRTQRADVIVSHVPPAGLGDTPDDHYHKGFAAYRWLCDKTKPALWIHGHTALAASPSWLVDHGPTKVINATGAVLVELVRSPAGLATVGAATDDREQIEAR